MPKTTLVAIAATVIMWGSSFPVTRTALTEMSPMELAFLRFAIASAAVAPMLLRTRLSFSARDCALILPAGILGVGVYATALNFGLSRIGAGPASFIIEFGTPLTILGSALVFGECLGRLAWIGVAVGFTGVACIASEGAAELRLTDVRWNGAALVVLLAAASHAASFILQKPVLARHEPTKVAALMMLSGSLALGLVSGFPFHRLAGLSTQGWACLLYLGLMPGALANALWAHALSRLPAGRAAVALYAVPLVSQALAVTWLGEPVRSVEVLGSGLILLSLALVTFRPSRLSRTKVRLAA
ncbi:DMT family transporter [Microvirga sesbaniae]|uniref:DMT family transporter n=1 Tax=Microvirga sesbaniae TaxID=681392 RepID=UPI0021C604BF|nr:DMT family transporter [Microvirga sp. HBU67692]